MAQLLGNAVELVVGFETSFGVPSAVGYKVPFIPSLDVGSDQAINASGVINGSASPSEPFLGFKDGKISGTFILDDKAFPIFMKGLLGTPTTTGAGPTYVHTYKIGTTIPTMFFEINHSDAAGGLFYSTIGVGLNSFSVGFSGDDELTVTIDGIAKDTNKTTTSIATGGITDMTDGVKFSKFQGAIAGLTQDISAFDISYSNNIDSGIYLIDGTGSRGAVPKGISDVNGSFEALLDDDALSLSARNFTTMDLKATLTNGTSIIEFHMEESKLNAKTNAMIDTPSGLKTPFTYQSFLKAGVNNSALQVTITNESATVPV